MAMLMVVPADRGLNGDNGVDMNAAVPYVPQKSYNIGESIFHTEWNDFGKVLGKKRTSDGSYAIVVNFEKNGQRMLIENNSINDNQDTAAP